jgi:hypothetical protein
MRKDLQMAKKVYKRPEMESYRYMERRALACEKVTGTVCEACQENPDYYSTNYPS